MKEADHYSFPRESASVLLLQNPGGFVIVSRFGPVAQLVEQRIENPCVGGSIPPQATKIKAVSHETAFSFSCGFLRFLEHRPPQGMTFLSLIEIEGMIQLQRLVEFLPAL